MASNTPVDSIVPKYLVVTDRQELAPDIVRYTVVGANGNLENSFRGLYKELIREGYAPALRRSGPSIYLVVARIGTGFNKVLWLTLALLTLAMVYVSGEALGRGIMTPLLYLVGLLGPLLIHESGHWIMMKKYDVPRSPPYLIPAPPLQLGFLGTLGAVINMKWIPVTADELALVGVMGPLFGFLAAIPVAIVGLHMSSFLAPSVASAISAESMTSFTMVPVIMELLLTFVHAPAGYIVILSPLGLASYIVFFVTFLNLIPIGQLDGGHVVRAAVGEQGHLIISILFVILLFVIGAYFQVMLFFAVIALLLLLITRGRHPGPALQSSGLTWKGYVAVAIYGLLLALTMPIPA